MFNVITTGLVMLAAIKIGQTLFGVGQWTVVAVMAVASIVYSAVFVIPVAIQWWNVWYPGFEPGGGGYIVQRMLSAKSEGHCVGGSILYHGRALLWIL